MEVKTLDEKVGINGDSIRSVRESFGHSREQFSQLTGLSVGKLRNYEVGITPITKKVKTKVLKAIINFWDSKENEVQEAEMYQDNILVPERESENRLIQETLECLSLLKPQEREVLIKRYGLDGEDPFTRKEIMEYSQENWPTINPKTGKMGISVSRVDQLEETALKKLKQRLWSRGLYKSKPMWEKPELEQIYQTPHKECLSCLKIFEEEFGQQYKTA